MGAHRTQAWQSGLTRLIDTPIS
ncbi:hypothetical protein CCACVL1_01769, partial [Corchorus capsularis]